METHTHTTITDLFAKYGSSPNGLSTSKVAVHHQRFGKNIVEFRHINPLSIFIRQITSNPLLIILAIATGISYFLGQHISSYYIFTIILVGILLGFWNEYSAEKTVDALLKRISLHALVLRDGQEVEVPVTELTIGDIVLLSPGSIIPADLQLYETHHLELNESVITGESVAVEKHAEHLALHKATSAYMGTTVVSGFGKGIVIAIGKQTEFGKIAKSTTYLKPLTEFQKGLSQFGRLIITIIIILTFGLFGLNALLGRNILESLLFSLAIAVGLTPELLPVIVTISLAHGAGNLAKKHVIAKRLLAIENLGNMDILCTDKTGTLTEGVIKLQTFCNPEHQEDKQVLKDALLCSTHIRVSKKNPGGGIDEALWEYAKTHDVYPPDAKLLYQEPFDFEKKAMFVVIEDGTKPTLIVKGAVDSILPLCLHEEHEKKLQSFFHTLNEEGQRAVIVAQKHVEKKSSYSWSDVSHLTYSGYVTFSDIPKESVREALTRLENLNVQVKILTGDNEFVSKFVCEKVGLGTSKLLTGEELTTLSHEELQSKVLETQIFARLTPQQKLQIITLLQHLGHTVGYLGDGINDIPSLHAADAGISVNTAVDVAKEAASIVLLRKSLHVLADGITEGRKTFNNTIKYILMSTSSNFGNMFSAAGASFLLPFLPMTPLQILLTNGLYDISQTTLPTDTVDHSSLVKPRHWNISFIKNYMLFFGPISSLFDFCTFAILLYLFKANASLFQTGWFMESLATEILVVFVIRTARTPFFLSKPSKALTITSICIVLLGLLLPFTPLGATFGFTPPPLSYLGILVVLIIVYLFLIEIVKNIFLKKFSL